MSSTGDVFLQARALDVVALAFSSLGDTEMTEGALGDWTRREVALGDVGWSVAASMGEDMAFTNTIAFTERSHGLVRHNNFPIRVTVTNIPTGLTLSNAWMTVKTAEADADPGVFQLAITSVSSAAGQITDTGATDRVGQVYFTPTVAQVNLMTAGITYYGDIKLRYSDSSHRPLMKFTLTPGQGITQATV